MTKVILNSECHSTITRYGDPAEEYDGDDTSHEHIYHSYSINTSKKDYNENRFDIVSLFDVDCSKDYYLLYVVYTTGDSFSTDSGNVTEIGIFETEEECEIISQIIKYFYDDVHNNKKKQIDSIYSFQIQIDNRTYDIPCGTWQGYFERLEDVEYVQITHDARRDIK